MSKITMVSIGLILATTWTGILAQADDPNETTKIGIYDNRAIAIAYAASKFNPVGKQMKLYERAKAEGDKETQKKLEDWGQKHQRQLHRQGFGRVPVDDLLLHVKDQLPVVASQTGVVAIVWQCNFHLDKVEVVDVTAELVALFEPNEKTLKNIEMIKNQEPVDLDELEQMHRQEK